MAKRKTKKEIQGLGDVVAAVTSAVGIEPCDNCKDRQFSLNRLFNFKKVKSEMTPNDKEHFKIFLDAKGQRVIDGKRTELIFEDVDYLNGLYKYYFGIDNSNCPNCSKVHETIIKDLYKLYSFESN
jgi:hypothetical protein